MGASAVPSREDGLLVSSSEPYDSSIPDDEELIEARGDNLADISSSIAISGSVGNDA